MNDNNPKILLIASIDFEGYPTGGVSVFSNNLIKSFGNDVALVGISTEKSYKTGTWQKKMVSGIELQYFPALYIKKKYDKKPLIPARLIWFFALRLNKKKILACGINNAIIQSTDTIFAIHNWNLNICYRFAGLTNPLIQSRYKWSRILSNIYEQKLISKLRFVNTFFAASGKMEIEEYEKKLKEYGLSIKINQLTTKLDPKTFYKRDKKLIRKELNFPIDSNIIVTTGRLSSVKGWHLLINSFIVFQKTNQNSLLIFVGDGEDRAKIEMYIYSRNMSKHIYLIGYQSLNILSKYLCSADLYVMGSFYEGWPTTMIEALACGLPICTTNFRSAKEIINSSKLGYVVDNRVPEEFASMMQKAISIEYDEEFYASELKKYSVLNLRTQIMKMWQII